MNADLEFSERKAPGRPKTLRAVVIGAILLGIAALALFLLFRPRHSATALLRLLPPGADLYAVADVQGLQSNLGVKRLLADPPSFSREEEYEQFVQGTGFRYQQDLRQLALAKVGSDWHGAAQVRLDRSKAIPYLESQGAEKVEEQGQTIYTFGQVRPFRLVLLADNLAIFTVGSNTDPIRRMVRRGLGQLEESGMEELERADFAGHLLEKSKLQIVGKVSQLLDNTSSGSPSIALGMAKALLQGSTMLYVSVDSGLTSLDFRVEAECNTLADAERIAQTFQVFSKILQAMPQSPAQTLDQKLPMLLGGIVVQQAQQSVVLTWRWDRETLRLLEQGSP